MSQQGDERDGSLYVFGPMRPTCDRHSRFAFCSIFVKQNVLKQTHQSADCFDTVSITDARGKDSSHPSLVSSLSYILRNEMEAAQFVLSSASFWINFNLRCLSINDSSENLHITSACLLL